VLPGCTLVLCDANRGSRIPLWPADTILYMASVLEGSGRLAWCVSRHAQTTTGPSNA
jgi:hypothetical protein